MNTEQTKNEAIVLQPFVDIYEEDNSIILKADLPGVIKDDVDIQLHDNVLSINALADKYLSEELFSDADNIKPIRYKRKFNIGPELDSDEVNAVLKDGVLTMSLNKKASVLSRKINVQLN